MFVLRKTFGAYSAGTAVYEHEGEFQIGLYKEAREVPTELVVERRSMTRMVPTTNSRQRAREKKAHGKRP